MNTLVFIDELFGLELSGLISNDENTTYIKDNNNYEWPLIVNFDDKEIRWEIALFHKDNGKLLLKSVYKGKDGKTDRIDSVVLSDIKELINYE